jgi:hypothetical protein
VGEDPGAVTGRGSSPPQDRAPLAPEELARIAARTVAHYDGRLLFWQGTAITT